MVAVHARYHQYCHRTFCNIPKESNERTTKIDKTEDTMRAVYEQVEALRGTQYMIPQEDLVAILGKGELANKTITTHLETHFGDRISVVTHPGRGTKYFIDEPDARTV